MTKILLVEDDKSLREIYGVRLLAEGYDIVSAGDGEEALAMAIKDRPQLIVSDVMMPKISGFDMLDILRSTTETRDIKVIMMTALSSEDQRARGEALGADRYLVKSQVGIEDVVRTVHEVLGDAPGARQIDFGSSSTSAPATAQTAQQQMQTQPSDEQPQVATPAPQPAVRSAPPIAQRPTIAPHSPAPIAPSPQPQQSNNTDDATNTVAAAPQEVAAPQMPEETPVAPQPQSSLPQPTAPFSTDRPANLGERVIHPIGPDAPEKKDLNSLMAQELSGGAEDTLSTDQQPAPYEQPAYTPSPATMSQTPEAAQPPTEEPATAQDASEQAPPQREESGISFEETPRPPVPPQPPTAQ